MDGSIEEAYPRYGVSTRTDGQNRMHQGQFTDQQAQSNVRVNRVFEQRHIIFIDTVGKKAFFFLPSPRACVCPRFEDHKRKDKLWRRLYSTAGGNPLHAIGHRPLDGRLEA
jgi:hypothetical protein